MAERDGLWLFPKSEINLPASGVIAFVYLSLPYMVGDGLRCVWERAERCGTKYLIMKMESLFRKGFAATLLSKMMRHLMT